MIANSGRLKPISGNRGYTFLELVIVITIISILIAVALNRYSYLLVDVERTSMEHDLGVMRSAISMQVAAHYLDGNMDGLQLLVNSNPMDLLAETPKNYLGELSEVAAEEKEVGSWYFDADNGTLIYSVINQRYFESESSSGWVRFKISPVYSEKVLGTVKKAYLSGLRLRSIEPYRWLKKMD